jgi:hypothetical protein
VIRSDHLIRREQMIKCTKGQVRRLKTALRWKIRDLSPKTKRDYQAYFDYLRPIADTPLGV